MQDKSAEVLGIARDALVKVAEERDTVTAENTALKHKLAAVEQRLECEKLAAEMHEKGIHTDQSFVDLVDDLVKSAEAGKLPVLQEAIRMSAPNMGEKIAFVNHDESSGAGMSQLESFVVGSVG